MLVTAAGLTVKSLQQLTRQDLGLVTDNVLTFSITVPTSPQPTAAERARVMQILPVFEERLRALPGVVSAGAINMLPIAQTGTNGQVYLRDRQLKREEAPIAEFRVVSPGYFDTVAVKVIAGRGIDTRDSAASANVVVINETLAHTLWPGQPPAAVLGQLMGTGFDDGKTFREIVGITRDVRIARSIRRRLAETYVPAAQFPLPT